MSDFTRFICTTCDAVHRYKPRGGCSREGCDGEHFKVPLADAKRDADKVLRVLGEFCERIVVAGSIRRGRQFVKDIELVAEPHMLPSEPTLFDEAGAEMVSALERRVPQLVCRQSSGLIFDEETARNTNG